MPLYNNEKVIRVSWLLYFIDALHSLWANLVKTTFEERRSSLITFWSVLTQYWQLTAPNGLFKMKLSKMSTISIFFELALEYFESNLPSNPSISEKKVLVKNLYAIYLCIDFIFWVDIGEARYPEKFMRKCRSLWHTKYFLIKQRDNNSVIKTFLSNKFCWASHCASELTPAFSFLFFIFISH